jgi:RNA polymerase sigma-70 factor (ECF subfamily)
MATDGQAGITVYCIIPAHLAAKLHDPLRRHFRNDPMVEVVVERRQRDRRRSSSQGGRRQAERRGLTALRETPALPRKARTHADELSFVEYLGVTGQPAEDDETERLIHRVHDGDYEAFGELYLRYFDRIYGYQRLLLRDATEAEDAAQDVFMRAFEALPRYEIQAGRPFRLWLFRIARNHAINCLKRAARLQVEEPHAIARRQRDEATERDLQALSWVTDAELVMLVERLPLAQRQVLTLQFMLGMRTSEIAELLERTPEAVRQLRRRAIIFLEARLTAIGRRPVRPGREPMMVMLRQARIVRRRKFALL